MNRGVINYYAAIILVGVIFIVLLGLFFVMNAGVNNQISALPALFD
jgi:hypothetical protein